jgi:hypothetical protein
MQATGLVGYCEIALKHSHDPLTITYINEAYSQVLLAHQTSPSPWSD